MWKRIPAHLRRWEHGLTLVIVVLFLVATTLIFTGSDHGMPLLFVALVLNAINAWVHERRRRRQRHTSGS